MLYKQVPDYKFLKTFACACYPHLRHYTCHKFNFHCQECNFLGYSSNHKGYKCLVSSGRIYISKDVLFNEIIFPYPLLSPSSSTPSIPTSSLSSPFPITPNLVNHSNPATKSNSPSTNTPSTHSQTSTSITSQQLYPPLSLKHLPSNIPSTIQAPSSNSPSTPAIPIDNSPTPQNNSPRSSTTSSNQVPHPEHSPPHHLPFL